MPVTEEVREGLIPINGDVFYPIRAGIVILLPQLSIVTKVGDTRPSAATLDATKRQVRDFYDSVGWKPTEVGFADASLFEDLRQVSEPYRHRANVRVREQLPRAGAYLLDAGSGAVQFQDYRDFSDGFDLRICVDFSMTALHEARNQLGEDALYLLADITNLPLVDNSIDAVVCLHTIYHVPSCQQPQAFMELARVVSAKGSAVIVYAWKPSILTRLINLPITVPTRLRGLLGNNFVTRALGFERKATTDGDLYFAPQSYKWFITHSWPFSYTVYTWRSIGVGALKLYFPNTARGARWLARLALFEDAHPRYCGKWGMYPLIVLAPPKTHAS